jgi:ubiquinone/menaquinone biosynthesis C-methylase UbiE
MQAYGPSFARVYNLRWTAFATQVAPRIRACYETGPLRGENPHVLDLCCGTGQLALHFLDHGYQVTGLDLSEAMLEHARANNAVYIIAGQARFVQGDAAEFILPEKYGLVVSTYDALNHLPDFDALTGCFRSVYRVLAEDGMFIFDLNTLEGLRRWTSISVSDSPEMMLVIRSLFDEQQQKAFTSISGFIAAGNGLYERFEETAYNRFFAMAEVRKALFDCGFRRVRFAREQDLQKPLESPETEQRVFIVAEK